MFAPWRAGDLYGGVEKNKNISSMTKDDLHMQQSNLLKSLKTNIGFQSYEEKEIEATSSCVCVCLKHLTMRTRKRLQHVTSPHYPLGTTANQITNKNLVKLRDISDILLTLPSARTRRWAGKTAKGR